MIHVQPTDLEQRIMTTLQQIAAQAESENTDWPYPDWTSKVKAGLGMIAHDLPKCTWYASGGGNTDGGEWLLDGVAWQYDDRGQLNLPFVLESEWRRTPNELERDFQKLMVIRSELRIMVFNEALKADAGKRFEELIECVKEFRDSVSGDRYLLACRCWETKKFIFRNLQTD
jgi:hypothetical protein